MSLPIAILAGGLATRLRPITEKIPKALIPVKGEPFACHLLRLLERNGFKNVVFLVGYKGNEIENAIGDGNKFIQVLNPNISGGTDLNYSQCQWFFEKHFKLEMYSPTATYNKEDCIFISKLLMSLIYKYKNIYTDEYYLDKYDPILHLPIELAIQIISYEPNSYLDKAARTFYFSREFAKINQTLN